MTKPKTKPKTKSTKNNTNTPRYADAIAIEILNKYKDPVTSTTILPDDYILASSYIGCFVRCEVLSREILDLTDENRKLKENAIKLNWYGLDS